MPFQLRFPALAVAGLSLFLVACGGDSDNHGDAADQAKPLSLQVLYTNDHHSYFEGQSYDLKLDYDANQPGELERAEDAAVGAERVDQDLGDDGEPDLAALGTAFPLRTSPFRG